MNTDFDKVFQKKNNKNVPIPKVLLDELNKKLSNGMKYIDCGDGQCMLVSETNEISFGGLEVVIDDSMRKYIDKNNITQTDILDYSYNTQRPLHLKLKKDGMVLMNNQEISISKIKFNPFENLEMRGGEILAYPAPFPDPFEIVLSDDKYIVFTKIQRKPCDEKNCTMWRTVDDSPVVLQIKVNSRLHKMSCNVGLNLINEKSVANIVRYLSVFFALGTGKGKINDTEIKLVDDSTNINFDKVTLTFWEKALAVEEALGKKFQTVEANINNETASNIEAIYQMLVMRKPIRSTDSLNKLTCSLDIVDGHSMEELMSDKGTFVFESTHRYKVWNEIIELPSITVVMDVIISDIQKKGDKQELFIDNSVSRAFYSELAFANEELRKEYIKEDSLRDFYEAQTLTELFSEMVKNK